MIIVIVFVSSYINSNFVTLSLHFDSHFFQVDLGKMVPECLHAGFYWN